MIKQPSLLSGHFTLHDRRDACPTGFVMKIAQFRYIIYLIVEMQEIEKLGA